MPILNFPDELPESADYRQAFVLATMMWPKDAGKAAEIVVLLREAQEQANSRDDFVRSLHFEAATKNANLGQRMKHGGISGEVLIAAWQIASYLRKRPTTLNDAYLLTAKLHSTNYEDARKFLYEFRPVCHLWAAQRLIDLYYGLGEGAALDNLPQLFAVSEHLRKFGESCIVGSPRLPVLRPGESFQAPEEMALPSGSVEVPPIPPNGLEELGGN